MPKIIKTIKTEDSVVEIWDDGCKRETTIELLEDPVWFTYSDRRSKKDIKWHEKWSNTAYFADIGQAEDWLAGKYVIGDGPDGVTYNQAPSRYIVREVVKQTIFTKDSDLKQNVDNATKEALEAK